MERNGDSVAVFSLVEYGMEEYWNWTSDDELEFSGAILRWKKGLKWYHQIEGILKRKRMFDSVDLYQQSLSLELCEFLMGVWNTKVYFLGIEDIISFQAFV